MKAILRGQPEAISSLEDSLLVCSRWQRLGAFMTLKILLAGLIAFLCAGCSSMGRLETTAGAPESDHTYFVFGVHPNDLSVVVFQGDIGHGRFRQDILATATFFGTAEDGYVMGETHGGKILAITKIVDQDEHKFLHPAFAPCGNTQTLVFRASAGKVIYLTDVTYERNRDSVVPSYNRDIEGARAFLKKHYPQLADKLEQGYYDLMPTAQSCYM